MVVYNLKETERSHAALSSEEARCVELLYGEAINRKAACRTFAAFRTDRF